MFSFFFFKGNNIFAHLQSPEYRKVMKLLKHAILATDLSNYIRYLSTYTIIWYYITNIIGGKKIKNELFRQKTAFMKSSSSKKCS